MLSEIGSNFWLSNKNSKAVNTIDDNLFSLNYEDYVYTSSGRSAIKLLLRDIKDSKKHVLLPVFTCESVIEPFIKTGYEVYFYDIRQDFSIDFNSFFKLIDEKQPSIIYFHSYFGFDTLQPIRAKIKTIRNSGIVVIDDVTQCLYSTFPRIDADYQLGSFRKWAGIPDGGYLIKANGYIEKKPKIYDEKLLNAKIKAMKAKHDFLFNGIGEKSEFLKLYSDAEDILDDQEDIYLMSDFSIKEQANLDKAELKRKRRKNFDFLLKNVQKKNVVPAILFLPQNAVPLYFPVFCNGSRSKLQAVLREHSIYAPIVWPRANCINIDYSYNARRLYDDLLCIPCDQRYGIEEMNKVVEILNGEIEK